MNTYVIAVRREHRKQVQEDWAEPLFRMKDLEIEGDPRHLRLLASGSEAVLQAVTSQFSTFCHIEPVMEHLPLSRT